ncbi:TonB-system energizer ExbB [Hahella sp. KA22]|uniref:TonB-system energizer ExbB n=1 Tax=Hahella sp. KA22 TaxID=1628392 RepID=UPI000FDEB38B|nr:TonB-system energizer ExbB [Hahella sp. KA22]AZZ95273.1 TonB-system energizer ExbB [Hahella sp. KA22]QAY52918.1 TonB-system energizer ExbB [Hahella sp. KA22]
MEFLSEYLDLTIFGILGLMSFTVVWLSIERWLFMRALSLPDYQNFDRLTVDLTKHLTTISSIGANAPYVGLLGTVAGILLTFYQIGQSGNVEVGAIMSGLALALKATALGLLVAIPTLMIYNALTRKVEVTQALWRADRDTRQGSQAHYEKV